MIIQQLFNGLALGMVYALIAVGFSLVFGVLKLVNFSHGAVYAFGAHMALLILGFSVHPLIAIAAATVMTGVLGVVIDRLALAPLRKKKSIPIAALITTIGVSYIIQNVLAIWFGNHRRYFPSVFPFQRLNVFGAYISSVQLWMTGVSLVLMLFLTLFIKYTKIGLAMRAVEQNPKAASLMGINVNSIITLTFFLAGATASIAGGLVSGFYHIVYPTMGWIAQKAFSAAVLGGIGSLPGAVIGGLLIGVIESMAATFWGSAYRDSVAFLVLIVILIIRPNGLFGKKELVKV